MSEKITHTGGCHCGAVRFEVSAPAVLRATYCNCSVCRRAGFLHLEVERGDFHLMSGEDALTEYTFNTGTARHLFCGTCGIKSFYVPRSKPDGYSVNINCLAKDTISGVETAEFDGNNWELSFAQRIS